MLQQAQKKPLPVEDVMLLSQSKLSDCHANKAVVRAAASMSQRLFRSPAVYLLPEDGRAVSGLTD